MINLLKNLFKKQKDLVETKSKVDCSEMKSKNTYGLKQDDIDFFYYLYGLDQDEKMVVLSGFKYLTNHYLMSNLKPDVTKLNSELRIFLTEVYEKQTEFYETIINVNDFKIINIFLNDKNYVSTYRQPKQIEEIKQQIKQMNCLFKEIEQLYPVETENCNLKEQLTERFFDLEKYEQLKLKFPFIQYVDLKDYLDRNKKIINELKYVRFNGFPKP